MGLIIHQSSINDFRLCPERARLAVTDRIEISSDHIEIGYSVHGFMEGILRGIKEAGEEPPYGDLLEEALQGLERAADAGVPLLGHKTWNAAEKRLRRAIEVIYDWWDKHGRYDVCADTTAWQIEQRFEFSANGFKFAGTVDFWDGEKFFDFKTGKVKYDQAYQIDTFNIQRAVYVMAAIALGWIKDEDPTDFTFVYADGRQERTENGLVTLPAWVYTTTVDVRHMEALIAEVEMGIGHAFNVIGLERRWPVNPSGWWCSPKWCQYIDKCEAGRLASLFRKKEVEE